MSDIKTSQFTISPMNFKTIMSKSHDSTHSFKSINTENAVLLILLLQATVKT